MIKYNGHHLLAPSHITDTLIIETFKFVTQFYKLSTIQTSEDKLIFYLKKNQQFFTKIKK